MLQITDQLFQVILLISRLNWKVMPQSQVKEERLLIARRGRERSCIGSQYSETEQEWWIPFLVRVKDGNHLSMETSCLLSPFFQGSQREDMAGCHFPPYFLAIVSFILHYELFFVLYAYTLQRSLAENKQLRRMGKRTPELQFIQKNKFSEGLCGLIVGLQAGPVFSWQAQSQEASWNSASLDLFYLESSSKKMYS